MDMHWQRPYRLVPDEQPAPAGGQPYEYVPRHGLIAAHLVQVAEIVLDAAGGPVDPEAVLRHFAVRWPQWNDEQPGGMARLDRTEDAAHLLEVLEQFDLVGPADAAGRRPVLIGRSARARRQAMDKAKAVRHVAGQLAAGGGGA